jgi:hypothetical protein
MERLESFVAGSLLKRLQPAEGQVREARCALFRGAVAFVDISGYTALAEALCAKGADGIEQLGQTLDRALRGYVRIMQETGGEIACFAGDAFVAYWPADDGNLPRVLKKAHDAARALHAARDVPPTSAAAIPTLHIGVSAGEIWAARLGGEDVWHVLLAGPAVRQACNAATRAEAGTTVVAPEAGPFIAQAPDIVDHSVTGADRLDAPMSPLDLRGHVPKRVLDYIGEGYATWIPQRRTICALFVKIDGLDERAPHALAQHQAVVTSLQLALRPYTGATGTLLLDDKGLVFTLCLGMPHDAHADDALRAVRGGFAIRSELSRLGLDCAIGVASGEGICLPLGGPERRHYWSAGRFMHVAGRLMQAAGRGLLCTEEVADRVRRFVTLSPERPLTLKGVRWPIRAFRVREAASFDDETDRLYGREDEEAAIDQRLAAFAQGHGAVLSITGEAGLGKTILVDYLRRSAERRGIQCLRGGAGSVEIAAAYAAWRPVFGRLLADPRGAPPSTAEDRRARLGELRHPLLASLVNAVVPGFLEETPVVQGLTGQARADATSTVLGEVLEAHATARFVLILEDCHWMDSASWRLLLRVAQGHPQALIVLTSRPITDVQEAGALRTLSGFVEMKLAPLRADAINLLVESMLAGRSTPPELIDEIAERSRGNPLLAREYALLLASHADRPEPHGLLAGPPAKSIDEATRGLIANRLDALTPAEDLALKAASVIGDRFSVDLIARVYPSAQGTQVIDAVLASLTERQLLSQESVESRRFAFQHALIREVTYQQLTRDQRRDLHRLVAETLERKHEADLRPYFATLAHHWSQAEVPEATISYSDRAASQALAAGAFEETERLLGMCLRVAKEAGITIDAVRRIRWQRQLSDTRHGMGQLEPRGAAAHYALRLAGLSRSHSAPVLLAQAGARVCRMALHRIVPPPRIGGDATTMDVARAFRHSAEVCYFNNDMIGMICDSIGAMTYSSSLPASAVLAGASTELGGILSIAGLRRIGERILHRAIEIAEAADDHAAQAYAHMVSCLYYVGMGDWPSAERSARRCQELCEPMDDRVIWTNAQAVRFWMSHYRSHEAAALDAARRLRDRAGETGNRQHRAWAFRCLAVCALRRMDAVEAVAQVQAALQGLGETAALNERIPTLGILALAQLRTNDVWSARATAKEALAQVVHVTRPIGQSTLEGYSSLLTVALDAWQEERTPEWRRAIVMCLRVLKRYRKGFLVGEPRYHLHRGDFQRLVGSLAAARRSYRRGEAAAIRLGMPWETKRCQQALAELSGSMR